MFLYVTSFERVFCLFCYHLLYLYDVTHICLCLYMFSLVPKPQPSLSDFEKEIHFGSWEKTSSLPSDKTHPISQPTKELKDLNLFGVTRPFIPAW